MDKLFAKNLNGFMESSDDSDHDSIDFDSEDYTPSIDEETGKRLQTIKFRQNGEIPKRKLTQKTSRNSSQSIERRPTRRPDPKVSNRNALLARENRRRKKELVIQMENEYTEVKDENKNLKKILKKQNRVIQKLNLEKSYLRSVLSNRTEIVEILKTLKNGKNTITSSVFDIKSEFSVPVAPASSTSSLSSSSDTDGTYRDPLLSESSIFYEDQNSLFTDYTHYERRSSSGFASIDDDLNGWDNLLHDNNFDFNRDISDIQSEHNYTNHKYIKDDNEIKTPAVGIGKENMSKPGVCLHISSGKISLEFCGTCHINAQSSWLDNL